ncbi:MAG: SsrA-binding protein SmpB [Candidatus Magasanikbacteria bacterium]|nr:SsrA-binding protein SmpB [Candidatus Magasanikbacteria bacterium]
MPTYATNKKARFNFEILEEIEAGLVLSGQEVKSIRNGGAKLQGSHLSFIKTDAFVSSMRISPYKFAGKLDEYDPNQQRKLLLSKKEIEYLRGKSQEKGLTIVPISLYNKGRFIKIKLGLAKGKKNYDKRETIKKRDADREMGRIIKNSL